MKTAGLRIQTPALLALEASNSSRRRHRRGVDTVLSPPKRYREV